MDLIIYFIIMIIFGITCIVLLYTILWLIISIYGYHLTGLWETGVIYNIRGLGKLRVNYGNLNNPPPPIGYLEAKFGDKLELIDNKSIGFIEYINHDDGIFNTLFRLLVFLFTGSYLFGWF